MSQPYCGAGPKPVVQQSKANTTTVPTVQQKPTTDMWQNFKKLTNFGVRPDKPINAVQVDTFYCEPCNLHCGVAQSYRAHLEEKTHKERLSYLAAQRPLPLKCVNYSTLCCELCNIKCSSINNLKDHERGIKHQKATLREKLSSNWLPLSDWKKLPTRAAATKTGDRSETLFKKNVKPEAALDSEKRPHPEFTLMSKEEERKMSNILNDHETNILAALHVGTDKAPTRFLASRTSSVSTVLKNTSSATFKNRFGTPIIFSERVPIGMPHSVIKNYDLLQEVKGPDGANLQYIRYITGATLVALRGRGTGYLEYKTGRESLEPLHILVQHYNAEALKEARKLAVELVVMVRQEYLQLSKFIRAAPPKSYKYYSSVLHGSHLETTTNPEINQTKSLQQTVLDQPKKNVAQVQTQVANDVQEIDKLAVVVEQVQNTLQAQPMAAANQQSNQQQLMSEPNRTKETDQMNQILQQLQETLKPETVSSVQMQKQCQLTPPPHSTQQDNEFSQIMLQLQETLKPETDASVQEEKRQLIPSSPNNSQQDNQSLQIMKQLHETLQTQTDTSIKEQKQHQLTLLPHSTQQENLFSQIMQQLQATLQTETTVQDQKCQLSSPSHTTQQDNQYSQIMQQLQETLQTETAVQERKRQLSSTTHSTQQDNQFSQIMQQLQETLQTETAVQEQKCQVSHSPHSTQQDNQFSQIMQQLQETLKPQTETLVQEQKHQLIPSPSCTQQDNQFSQILRQMQETLKPQTETLVQEQKHQLMPPQYSTQKVYQLSQVVQRSQPTSQMQSNPTAQQIEFSPTQDMDQLTKAAQNLHQNFQMKLNITHQQENQMLQQSVQMQSTTTTSSQLLVSNTQKTDQFSHVVQQTLERQSGLGKMQYVEKVIHEVKLAFKYNSGISPIERLLLEKVMQQLQQILQSDHNISPAELDQLSNMLRHLPKMLKKQPEIQKIRSDMKLLVSAMKTLIMVLKTKPLASQDELNQLTDVMQTVVKVIKKQPTISNKRFRELKEISMELPNVLLLLQHVSVPNIVQLVKLSCEMQSFLENQTWRPTQTQEPSESPAQISPGQMQQNKQKKLFLDNPEHPVPTVGLKKIADELQSRLLENWLSRTSVEDSTEESNEKKEMIKGPAKSPTQIFPGHVQHNRPKSLLQDNQEGLVHTGGLKRKIDGTQSHAVENRLNTEDSNIKKGAPKQPEAFITNSNIPKKSVVRCGDKQVRITPIPPTVNSLYGSLAHVLLGPFPTTARLGKAATDLHQQILEFIKKNREMFITEINKLYGDLFPDHKLGQNKVFDDCCKYLAEPGLRGVQVIMIAVSTMLCTPIIVIYEDGESPKRIDPIQVSNPKPPVTILCRRGRTYFDPVDEFIIPSLVSSSDSNIFSKVSDSQASSISPSPCPITPLTKKAKLAMDSFMVATWFPSLFTTEKQEDVDRTLIEHNVDVACVQFTKCENLKTSTTNYLWLFNHLCISNTSLGVSLLCRKGFAEVSYDVQPYSSIVTATITFRDTHFYVIGCHLSRRYSLMCRYDVSYPELSRSLEKCPASCKIILLGNFRAQIGWRQLTFFERNLIGHDHRIEETNGNGVYLKLLAVQYNLRIITTFRKLEDIKDNENDEKPDEVCENDEIDEERKGQISHILLQQPFYKTATFVWPGSDALGRECNIVACKIYVAPL